jgi:hypothetical protein
MKRSLLAALMALALCVPASAKTIVILRGIAGEMVAPMLDYQADLTKKGHKVIMGSYIAPPQVKADYVIGHSRGADLAYSYPKAKIISIDPTFINPGCSQGKANCTNYHAPIDAFPFIFCCGGYSVRGANNIQVSGTPSFLIWAPGHVSMPTRVKPQVLKLIK